MDEQGKMTKLELLHELEKHFRAKMEFGMEQYKSAKERYEIVKGIIKELEGNGTPPDPTITSD